MNFKIAIVVSLLLLLFGCNISEKNNIYKKIPLESFVELDMLKSASQIVCSANLILVYNISDDMYRYSPHLLFYDKKLKLYAAHYFSSEKIESIKDRNIEAYINEERANRGQNYINDLPSQYSLNYINRNGMSIRMSDKVIKYMHIDSLSYKVFFDVEKSSNLYEGIGKNLAFRDSVFFLKYDTSEKYVFNISDLIFDYENRVITYSYFDKNGSLIKDSMIVKELEVLDAFYVKLYEKIKEQGVPPQKSTD